MMSMVRGKGKPYRIAVALQVLDTMLAEQLASSFQFLIRMLQDAQPEFAVGFNRDHSCMGESASGIDLEFDALLEIHEVELDLVG